MSPVLGPSQTFENIHWISESANWKKKKKTVWENTLENARIPVNVNLCNDNFTFFCLQKQKAFFLHFTCLCLQNKKQTSTFSNTHWELRETAMAPHSSTLAWKIPWMEEPGRLQSMGSLRVGQDWASSLSLFIFMHWRRKWQTHSSVLAWRIPRTGEPRRLQSLGSHRVGLKRFSSSSREPRGNLREAFQMLITVT